MMSYGFWIVLFTVFVIVGGLVGFVVATITGSLAWAIPAGIAIGLLAAGAVAWVSGNEV